jgi:hypothetical protein
MIPVTAEVSLFLRQEKEAQDALPSLWFILFPCTPCDPDSSANQGKNRFRLDGEASAITIFEPLRLSLSSKRSIICSRSPNSPNFASILVKISPTTRQYQKPYTSIGKTIFLIPCQI